MKKALVIVLLALGLVTRFAFFGHPNEIVFDEVHFGKFISGYYTHEYFFDIHPPLGKLMIAGFGKLTGFKPEFSFAEIGQKFPDEGYKALRFLPGLAGALLPLVIFLLALRLGLGHWSAFLAGIFIVLDNAILVQSRYILLDAFLLLFGFLSLYFYISFRSDRSMKNLLAMSIFGGLAMSIKWTGASFLGLAFLMEAHAILKERMIDLRHLAKVAISFIALPLIIYFSVFAVHFNLLSKSGPGDAFMSAEFRKTLSGSDEENDSNILPLNTFQKFLELNSEMYDSNQRLSATHPYGSKWYSWPFMSRSIFYWVNAGSRIYFLGNPVIWWASTFAVLILIFSHGIKRIFSEKVSAMLFLGYIINMLPFIGVQRVMFLYHYLTGLIFAILLLAYWIDKMPNKKTKKICLSLGLLALAAFIYFSPLSYGLPLSPDAYESRVWLGSWR